MKNRINYYFEDNERKINFDPHEQGEDGLVGCGIAMIISLLTLAIIFKLTYRYFYG